MKQGGDRLVRTSSTIEDEPLDLEQMAHIGGRLALAGLMAVPAPGELSRLEKQGLGVEKRSVVSGFVFRRVLCARCRFR